MSKFENQNQSKSDEEYVKNPDGTWKDGKKPKLFQEVEAELADKINSFGHDFVDRSKSVMNGMFKTYDAISQQILCLDICDEDYDENLKKLSKAITMVTKMISGCKTASDIMMKYPEIEKYEDHKRTLAKSKEKKKIRPFIEYTKADLSIVEVELYLEKYRRDVIEGEGVWMFVPPASIDGKVNKFLRNPLYHFADDPMEQKLYTEDQDCDSIDEADERRRMGDFGNASDNGDAENSSESDEPEFTEGEDDNPENPKRNTKEHTDYYTKGMAYFHEMKAREWVDAIKDEIEDIGESRFKMTSQLLKNMLKNEGIG